jgi:hypothetical protein
MPLHVPPPRTSRFGSPLVLSRVHWVRPELVAEVKFLTWTDDNLLRQVVYEGLREDKPASEVRRPVPHPKPAAQTNVKIVKGAEIVVKFPGARRHRQCVLKIDDHCPHQPWGVSLAVHGPRSKRPPLLRYGATPGTVLFPPLQGTSLT